MPLKKDGTWSLEELDVGGVGGALYQKAMRVIIKLNTAGMA